MKIKRQLTIPALPGAVDAADVGGGEMEVGNKMSPEQKEGMMIRLPQVLSWGACLTILATALKLTVSATAKDIALSTNGTEIVRVEVQSKARDEDHDEELKKLADTLHKIESAQAAQGTEIKNLSRLGERVDDKLDDILIRLPRQQ